MTEDQQIFPRWIRIFLSSWWPVPLLLGCHLFLGLSAASRKSATCDEGLHLVGGFSYWITGDYRINPESGNWPQRWAALPMRLEGYPFLSLDNSAWQNRDGCNFASQLLFDSDNNPDAMLLQGRAMIGLLSAALGTIVYLWSRQLFGAIGGLISLTLYAFSPTFLSNGFLVTADLASALFFSAAMWAMWTLLHRISALTLAIGAITVAGLLLSKFSGVLIAPMGLLLVVIRLFRSKPLVVVFWRSFQIRSRFNQLAVLTGVLMTVILGAVFLIWASYGFRYATMNTSESNNQPLVASWQKLSTHLRSVGPLVQFVGEHRLLPEPFLYGFAYTVASTESRQSFFNGKFGLHGWLGFFPYCLWLAAFVLAIATIISRGNLEILGSQYRQVFGQRLLSDSESHGIEMVVQELRFAQGSLCPPECDSASRSSCKRGLFLRLPKTAWHRRRSFPRASKRPAWSPVLGRSIPWHEVGSFSISPLPARSVNKLPPILFDHFYTADSKASSGSQISRPSMTYVQIKSASARTIGNLGL